MRLTEERIEFINQQILGALYNEEMIDIEGRESSLLVDLNRLVLQDLAHEDKIDDEIRQMIEKMRRDIPEGSPEWNAIFIQKKQELANRDNYVL